MSKLTEIKAILQTANIHELNEFVAAFDVCLSLSGLAMVIGSAPKNEVMHLTKHTHEIRMYKGTNQQYFPMIQAIKLVRHAQSGMALKEAKDYVDQQIAMHGDYVVISTAESFRAAWDLAAAWYTLGIVNRPSADLHVYEIL